MRVVYFGSPELSVPFLSALHKEADFEIVGVVSQPPKPVGRKGILTPCAIQQYAEQHQLTALPFTSLRSEEVLETLRALKPDLFVVVVYGKLIPKQLLDLPAYGCINVHPSLLPAYRGPTPYQAAILHGETETGVSIMKLIEEMDAGPVLAQATFPVDPRETSITIQQKIVDLGVPLLLAATREYIRGTLIPWEQSPDEVSYCSLLKKEDGHIDWNTSAMAIDQKIRAYQPWPGGYAFWNDQDKLIKLAILEAIPADVEHAHVPGTIFQQGKQVYVACGKFSTLNILRLRPEGKSDMNAIAYVQGHPTLLGSVLT